MFKKVDHIGIAVESLATAKALYEGLLGKPADAEEEVASEHVRTAFFEVGETHLELLEATSPDSAIARFLDKRGPGIHHICLEVDDLDATLERLKSQGVRLVSDEPRVGAGGKRVVFVHPRSAGGVLIELSQPA